MGGPVRVLVVDDSAVLRYAMSKYLDADPGVTVVGSARDGLDALDMIPDLKPDVVTLDVEMPRMDGLTALKHIMAECPTPVVMLSALTKRGARTTIQALMRGAVDFVSKPSAGADMQATIEELVVKLKVAAGTRLVTPHSSPPTPQRPPTTSKLGPRPFNRGDPLIVIGASTGGPRALQEVLSKLPADLPAAMTVVQHMPPGFTRSLARRLDEHSPLTVREATDGEVLARGLVLVAPGDFHLRFGAARQVILDHGPPQCHVRPAADVTMTSAAERYEAAVVGAVLTGMGADGTEGSRHIKAAGGKVVAEDETTSVVYGMPRSVVEAGLADQVVPLPEVAPALVEWVS
ncbi:MAG: chemotaxis response regulator protein-glutamate methylesterase [Chloroflexota bacterium]|nr:chemotaxis response regulator protein-glutamate methylesterase [Chloroflexota bacterium]